jgi:hypothetical protein
LADSVYWSNFGDNAIRGAPLAGRGNVATVYDLAQGVLGPRGVAIDPAAGRIYWANYGGGAIRGAPLAGGMVDTLYGPGPVVRVPGGVAIDPAAGLIYWANETDDTVRGGPLAGGGTAGSLYEGSPRGVSGPGGLAIDPAGGRIYWANLGDNTIRGARLAGGGSADIVYGPADGVSRPYGVAIDPAGGRIYWANLGDNTIRGAPLSGRGGVDTLYGPAHGVSDPYAVAIDPTTAGWSWIIAIIHEPRQSALPRWLSKSAGRLTNWLDNLGWLRSFSAGRIYWTNNGDDSIRGAPLAGRGAVDTLYSGSGQGVNGPSFLAVLGVPLGTGAPSISGGGQLGQRLSCSRGTWAADLLGSYLYRAPQSFAYQWLLGGSDVGGATLAAYTPTAPGSYTCRVTATNHAGSTKQTSAPVTVS